MLEGSTAPCPLSMLQDTGIQAMSRQTDEVKCNFKAMWFTCKLSPVKQVSSFRNTGAFITLAAASILLHCCVLEFRREVLSCAWAQGLLSWRLLLLLWTSPSQGHLWGEQGHCHPWTRPLWGTALPTSHLLSAVQGTRGSWALGRALFPLPCAKHSSGAQQPMKTLNSGLTAETLRTAGVAGALWQRGLLCSHPQHRSIRSLFSILKRRRTCICWRSDSVC